MRRRQTVREAAHVSVKGTVDGRKRRKSPNRGPSSSTVTTITADPQVMAAARAALRPGQRLVIISETRVDIVNS